MKKCYIPTVFNERTSDATNRIKDWMAKKINNGCQISFVVGQVSAHDDSLTIYWHAHKRNKFNRTKSHGAICLSGEKFSMTDKQ